MLRGRISIRCGECRRRLRLTGLAKAESIACPRYRCEGEHWYIRFDPRLIPGRDLPLAVYLTGDHPASILQTHLEISGRTRAVGRGQAVGASRYYRPLDWRIDVVIRCHACGSHVGIEGPTLFRRLDGVVGAIADRNPEMYDPAHPQRPQGNLYLPLWDVRVRTGAGADSSAHHMAERLLTTSERNRPIDRRWAPQP